MNNNKMEGFTQRILELTELGEQAGRQAITQMIEDAVNSEINNQIKIATIAMLDAGLSEETVINMLQKYWDLKRSEAKNFLFSARISKRMQGEKNE